MHAISQSSLTDSKLSKLANSSWMYTFFLFWVSPAIAMIVPLKKCFFLRIQSSDTASLFTNLELLHGLPKI